MKTKRTIRVSFSDNPPRLDFALPTSWEQLSQPELAGVYRIMSRFKCDSDEHRAFLVFKYLARVKIFGRDGERFRCRIIARQGKRRRVLFQLLSAEQVAELIEPLNFIFEPGDIPVRPDSWHGAKAVTAELHGVTFSDYLQMENLYQGFIASHDPQALIELAGILYPGIKPKHVDDVLLFAILQWIVQLKGLFRKMWPNFFKPASGSVSSPSMLEVMNNEIRVLTGGDVAKEDAIFATECWRALTELDYKGREAEEFNRQLSKVKG